MILAACGGRGNWEKDAEGLARAESREDNGKWEVGRVDRKEGDGKGWISMGRQGGGIWKGATERGRCGGAIGTGREWQWGGGQREEEMERGAVRQGRRWEGGNGEGGTMKEVGDGEGEKKGQEEGRFHRWI